VGFFLLVPAAIILPSAMDIFVYESWHWQYFPDMLIGVGVAGMFLYLDRPASPKPDGQFMPNSRRALWQSSPAFILMIILVLIFDAKDIGAYSATDYFCYYFVLPGLFALFLLSLALQRPGEKGLLKSRVGGSRRSYM
jgi:hypothetical protein